MPFVSELRFKRNGYALFGVFIASVGSWGISVGGVIRLHGIWCIDHQCGIVGRIRGRPCNKIAWSLSSIEDVNLWWVVSLQSLPCPNKLVGVMLGCCRPGRLCSGLS